MSLTFWQCRIDGAGDRPSLGLDVLQGIVRRARRVRVFAGKPTTGQLTLADDDGQAQLQRLTFGLVIVGIYALFHAVSSGSLIRLASRLAGWSPMPSAALPIGGAI